MVADALDRSMRSSRLRVRSTSLLFFALLSLLTYAQEEPIILVEKGKSEWHIVPLDGDSAMSTALFIQNAISRLTGVSLPINSSKRGRSIGIGTRARIK